MLGALALLLATYVVASISFPQLIARAHGIDLHEVGTRNLGAGNLGREVGPLQGITGGLLDALKSPLAMLAAGSLGAPRELQLACGVVAVAAQQWPLWHRFDGGRGNAPAMALFIAASLVAAVLAAAVVLAGLGWGVAQRLRRRHRVYSLGTPLGVLAGFVAYSLVALLVAEDATTALAAALVTVLVVVRRLTAGLRADLRLERGVSAILLRRLLFDRSEAQRRGSA